MKSKVVCMYLYSVDITIRLDRYLYETLSNNTPHDLQLSAVTQPNIIFIRFCFVITLLFSEWIL